jgi:hypothetical protein
MKFYTQIFDDYTKGRIPRIVKLERWTAWQTI